MCDKCGIIGRIHMQKPSTAGTQFGIEFYDLPYSSKEAKTLGLSLFQTRNIQFRVFSEDDERWHFTGLSASVHWLEDLRNVVDQAIEKVKAMEEHYHRKENHPNGTRE